MRRYALALGISAVTLMLRVVVLPVLGAEVPYILSFPAALISGWMAGRGPGLLTTAVTGAGAMYIVTARAPTAGDYVGLLLFLCTGAALSVLASGFRDRTARLRESERLYRTIGETIDYGVWTCDPSGRNTYASESFLKLVGMTQEECSGFGWGRVLHPDDRHRTLEAWRECVRTGGRWDVEHRFLGVDGKYHHILARGAPVRDDDGKLVCWAGINLDITALREAEQERLRLYESLKKNAEKLAASNRELEQFAFAASHDLQEPLRMSTIYTELLIRRLGSDVPADVAEFATVIRSSAKRQQALIADLVAYSRVAHEEAAFDVSANAQSALDRALEALRATVDEAGAEIVADALPHVACDETQLTQVFQNLVGNAVKYRDPARPLRIRISAAHDDGHCTITVADNGIGFSPEYAGHIFGLFKRLHRDGYAGTGLGLAICKRVVERYGGRIWAESELGAGSKFHFTLARREAAQSATSTEN